MKIAVLKETFPGECRVALVPDSLASLVNQELQILVERSAGEAAGFADTEYEAEGANLVSREEAFHADILLQVRTCSANPEAGRADLEQFRSGQTVIGMCDPLGNPQTIQEMANAGVTVLALEMVPRIARAQAMDALSSMAMIAGYRAVLLAANHLPRMFPMVTYAAGLLRPARVFVIGAGVAGLRAIATARQLGAVVQAHDIRPGSAEEVLSVGAKFIELPLNADTEDEGGYARALTEDDYGRQRELIQSIAVESDVVITTAAIPGAKSPLLLTATAIEQMRRGTVVVDLAAQGGGNCELTQPDKTTVANGVTILGPTNVTSQVPDHASQMFSSNVTKLLLHITKDGALDLNLEDEIVCETLVADNQQVVHTRLRDLLGLTEVDSVLSPETEGDVEPTPNAQQEDDAEDLEEEIQIEPEDADDSASSVAASSASSQADGSTPESRQTESKVVEIAENTVPSPEPAHESVTPPVPQEPTADIADTSSNHNQPADETEELLSALEETPHPHNSEVAHPDTSSRDDSAPTSIADQQPSQDSEETKQ
ncbi:MAG: NAD(P)(+) transhydrogenase (Re/Si-specific) subunit alpha [Planctomycetaceae bacterium]|nr:NAD(P)(+) transhydrogenase (Re/Si-specific) subunit alpha [Planctomycetaceae bacterium]